MSDADCTPGREPRSVATSKRVLLQVDIWPNVCIPEYTASLSPVD